MQVSRRGVRLVVGVAVLALVGGCGSAGSDPQTGDEETFFGYPDMVAEYRTALDSLELPEGAVVEDAPSGVEESGSFQEGFGEVSAVMAWNCAWGQEWLSLRGGSDAQAAHALDMYASIVETEAFERAFDDQSAKPVVREIIEKARLGDPSGVQQDVQTNCPAT